MHIARTILALVMALSLAVLPAAGAVSAVAKSAERAVATTVGAASAEMSEAMDDCCPDQPCDHGGDQCRSMATCAHQALSATEVAASQFVYPLVSGDRLSALADFVVPSHAGYPPFRPPRI